MTRDDIYQIAKEAGYDNPHGCGWDLFDIELFANPHGCGWDLFDIELFANLVAAAEREACAKVCEDEACGGSAFNSAAKHIAARIRARGQS